MSTNKKLSLNKDAIRTLSRTALQGVVGGAYNFGLIAKVDWTTMTCATCGCPKPNFGNVILPAINRMQF